MLQEIILRRHAGAYCQVFTCAVNQRGQAEQQRGVSQFRCQGERQACALVGLEVHREGVEAWNVGDGVVDEWVEGNGVRTAIRQCEEGVTGGVSNARAEATEQVGRRVVLERVVQSGEVRK